MQNEDPRLTAYALGELEPPERAEVEALLKNDPAAAQQVEEMRELAALVRRHLSTEDAPPLAPQQRDDILSEMNGPQVIVMPRNQRSGSSRRVWVPVAIAACAAVLAGSSVLYYEEHKPHKHSASLKPAAAEFEGHEASVLATDGEADARQTGFLAFDPAGAPAATPALPATPALSAVAFGVANEERQVASATASPAPTAPLAGVGGLSPAPTAVLAGTANSTREKSALGQDAQLRSEVAKSLKENRADTNAGAVGANNSTTIELEKTSPLGRALQAPSPAEPRPNAPAEQLAGTATGGAFSGSISYGKQAASADRSAGDVAEKAKNQAPLPVAPQAAARMPGSTAPASSPANGEVAVDAITSMTIAGTVTLRSSSPMPGQQADGNGRWENKLGVEALNGGALSKGPAGGSRAAGVMPAKPTSAKPADLSGADKRADQNGWQFMKEWNQPVRRFSDNGAPAPGAPSGSAGPVPEQVNRAAFPRQMDALKAAAKGEKAAVDERLAKAVPERKSLETATADRDGAKVTLGDKKMPEGAQKDQLRRDQPVDSAPFKLDAAIPESRFAAPAPLAEPQPVVTESFTTDSYDTVTDNPFLQVLVRGNETSTLSIDVDTASYSNVRRILTGGQRPPKGAVRIEELVNYFKYDYPEPKAGDPMSVSMDVGACPWTPEHRLLRVGLKARELDPEKRPQANLIFLIDVSGSMDEENKLPLVKKSLRLLVEQLGAQDRVGIVVYAGASGTVLEPTNEKKDIFNAIDRLSAGGSTNGGAGIQLAYKLAAKHFEKRRINRVILATDGDFNVGVTNQSDLTELIEKQAKSGVFLTVLGFGYGNLKDSTMEKLADKGNGNYGYIDTIAEGRKVLVEQMAGTLVTVAKDVKLQIEFNPAQVGAYRLIGYENRLLAKEDFNDDTKDAGEIGAGHTVTALYELVPAGQPIPGDRETTQVDPLKYQPNPTVAGNKLAQASVDAPRYELGRTRGSSADLADTRAPVDELLTLKLRWKAPDADVSIKREFPLTDPGLPLEKSSKDFRWAAAVAQFGMILRDSPYKGQATWSSVRELAAQGQGKDADTHRIEFLELIGKAEAVVK